MGGERKAQKNSRWTSSEAVNAAARGSRSVRVKPPWSSSVGELLRQREDHALSEEDDFGRTSMKTISLEGG